MRAVIDTNVVISGLLWHGAPHTLIEHAERGILTVVSSPALLAELERVLGRRKFRTALARGRATPQRLRRSFARMTEIVDPAKLPAPASRDPDDDRVLAAAVAARADLIVSGDRDLLSLGSYNGIRIVGPAEAVRLIARK